MRTSRMLVALFPLFLVSAVAHADPNAIAIHVDDSREALLLRDGKPICEAPCAVTVPRAGHYVIEESAATSARFTLPGDAASATIHVTHEEKSNALAGGIVLATTLPTAALFGGFAAAFALQPTCSSPICVGPSDFVSVFAVLAGVTGVIGITVGTVLVATKSTATHVVVTPAGIGGAF